MTAFVCSEGLAVPYICKIIHEGWNVRRHTFWIKLGKNQQGFFEDLK